MATGRMITNAICADRKINQLSDDTSRLAFTWLITFADCEGRTYGDPGMVRSMLFPRRGDVTIEQVEGYIKEWASLGLAVWYEAEGDMWIWFPKFEKNQPGMRKEKEAPSRIPSPPANDPPPTPPQTPPPPPSDGVPTPPEVRTDDVPSTPQVPVKRKEEKGREGNDGATPEKELSACLTEQDLEAIFIDVTAWPTFPSGDRGDCLNALEKMRPRYKTRPDMVDEGKKYFGYFKKAYPTSTKCFWLTDWWMTQIIPEKYLNGNGNGQRRTGRLGPEI